MRSVRLIGPVVMTVLLLTVLAGPARTAVAATPSGYLRVGHFVPGVGAVAITLDGHPLVAALAFQQVTSYVAVPAGQHTLAVVVPATAGAPGSEHSVTVTVVAGQSLTVLIVATASGSLATTSFTDDLSPPPPGDGKVRFIDTLGTIPSLGGHLTPVAGSATGAGVTVPATLDGQASPYLDVPGGAYNVVFTNAHTGSTVLTGNDWPVSAGTVASLVALPGRTAPTLEVIKDAVGATSAPVGGMQTGAGGMARRSLRAGVDPSGLAVGLALTGVLVIVLAGILTRRLRVSVGLLAMACAAGLAVHSAEGGASAPAVSVPPPTAGLTGWPPPVAAVTANASGRDPSTGRDPSISLAAAGTADPSDQPERIVAPAVGIDAPIVNVGRLPDGSMQVPTDFSVAAWYEDGPPPGEPGPAVIIGHVDSTSGPAVFWRLGALRPGEDVTVRSARATEKVQVTAIRSAPKDDFPTAAVFGPVASSQLRLITCSGPFDSATGHYLDNTIVFANLITG